MAGDDSTKISPTAYYTAQIWVELGLPHAELFSTRRGRALLAAYRWLERLTGVGSGESVLLRTLRNRHVTLDLAVRDHAPDRVVELGAGLSPRGVMFAVDHDIDAVDVDLAPMLALKRALVARRAPPPVAAALARRWRTETLDVTAADFADRLRRLLADAARPVVVAEGLIGYFDDPRKRQILSAVRRALDERRDAVFLADVRIADRPQEALRALRLGIRILTRNRGAAPGFASEAAVLELWRAAGFTCAELLPLRDSAEPPVLSRVLLARP